MKVRRIRPQGTTQAFRTGPQRHRPYGALEGVLS